MQREKGEGGAQEAIALYKQAIEADPQYGAAYWELGWSYQVAGELGAAVDAWDQLRRVDPKYPELDVHYPVAVMRRDQAAQLAALPDPGQLPPPEETPRPGPQLRIAAVGDVHMGMAWPEARAALPPNDATDLLLGVHPFLKDADITFGNLETALADDGDSKKCGPRSTKCFAFRVPTSYAKALRDAGFDVMSIANNHAGDFGMEGRYSTMRALDAVGIKHSGPVGDIASMETNGLKIGLIAFATGAESYRVQEIETARKLVAEIDRTHDLVIVSFHGGAEGTNAAHIAPGTEMFLGEDRGDVKKFARTVVDAGADLVLGHGPHLLRGMEIYRGRLIAYSLGNFSSWDTFNLTGPLGQTAVLKVTIASNGVATAAELVPVLIEKPGRPVPDQERRAIEIVRRLSQEDLGASMFDADGRWQRPALTSK